MISDPAPLFTDADVRALAARLKGLHALLSPGERALLHALLRQAAGGEQIDGTDAVGFAWAVGFNPFPYLDAVGADLRRDNALEKHDGGQ
jgi:hypothetical protein